MDERHDDTRENSTRPAADEFAELAATYETNDRRAAPAASCHVL